MARVSFLLFIVLLIFAPLAFGTTEQWSLALLETGSWAGLLVCVLRIRKEKSELLEVPGLTPFFFLLLYMLVQLLPLPAQLVRLISPQTYSLYAETLGIIEPAHWLSLSVDKKATLAEFCRYASYGAFYVLTVQLLRRADLLKKTVFIVVAFGALLSFFTILQFFTSKTMIYWLRHVPYHSLIMGPYVNHNHYAGLMNMLSPLALSLFLYYRPRVSYRRSIRQRIAALFNHPQANLHILLGFATVLMVTSIFFSLSRAGMISGCLAVMFFLVMLRGRQRHKENRVVLLLVLSLVVLAVGWFGWDPIIHRFAALKSPQGGLYEARLDFWKDSVGIVRDFPLTGTGFGAFVRTYPLYRTFPGPLILEHAHNDYLELLTDGGLVGLALVAWFLAVLFGKTYKVYRRRRERYAIHLYLACLAGMGAILVHSLTDFNMRIGANGFYFFFLAGLAVSAANTRFRQGFATYLPEVRDQRLLKSALPAAIVLALVCTVFNARLLLGGYYFKGIAAISLNSRIPRPELVRIRDQALLASRFDPLEARYSFAAGSTEAFLAHKDEMLARYAEAVRKNPLNSLYLQRLAHVLSVGGEKKKAEKLFLGGIRVDQNNPETYKRYGVWLLAQGRREEGLARFKKALGLESGKTNEYITVLLLNRVKDKDLHKAMPERARPWMRLAEYFLSVGKESRAEEAYHKALQYVEKERAARPWYFFHRVYMFHLQRKQYDKALAVVQKGVGDLPDNETMRLDLARVYERLGIPYRAREEYKKLLTLDPRNKQARKALNRLGEK